MSLLKDKKILLGVTGSIAAYKSAHLVRLLVKAGAEVQVLMTPGAARFITPLTLSTLSRKPVLSEFEKDNTGEWNNHVDLGLWADHFLIAPATANTLAKMAHGLCDNLLSAVYLSARCPVSVAPAMDLDMFAHPSTQNNLGLLKQHGVSVIEPNSGELASGLHGPGRMAEPEEIIAWLENFTGKNLSLKGKKALVSAGPTYENIDPVRFIGNHSSGKMGFAIAEELAARGAEVTLVSGPVQLQTRHPGIRRIDVVSAADMHKAVTAAFPGKHITVMCAAVADYTPKAKAKSKIKKNSGSLDIELVKTKDILSELGQNKKKNQVLVGFALETDNEHEYAQSKLQKKNLDMVVMNSLNETGAGFRLDTNRVHIFRKNGKVFDSGVQSKKEIASIIVDQITA